ncbi:MAG: type II toxin-antitoxin system CcdA family antitoxin [Magnetospirillum sp.]|nr:type II toxin-antitoxin system CcdA family antitoxin [Magnetospirillum sp.]
MNALFDPKAPKRAVNVSVNEDLLAQARALGINLSQTLEGRLADLVREAKAKAWAEENAEAIQSYRRYVAMRGIWSDGLRTF